MERVGRVGADTQPAVETLARKLGGALDVRPRGAPTRPTMFAGRVRPRSVREGSV